MKCINCGAEIKSEFKVCPYCGTASQIVPDYSVYDEADINIILESANQVSNKETVNKTAHKRPELTKEQREERARAKQKALEEAKKKKTKLTIIIVAVACILLIIGGIIAKIVIDNNNANSFDYQMSQADAAMFKGNIDDAEELYLKALSLSPDNVNVRLELADLYMKKKDVEEAKKYLKEVIQKDSLNYEAYKMLYDIYSAAEDVDAILELKEGVTDNKILSIFTDYSVDSAMLSELGGTYNKSITLYISAKKGMEIYYTLDGSDPRENGTRYKSAIEITEAGMHTVKVVTKNELGVFSNVVTETYLIEYEAPADPVVTPDGGVFDAPTYVYITIPAGCSAYYTWDNTDPTIESAKYVAPVLIPEGRNVFSVIIIDNETGLTSGIYREIFDYTTTDGEVLEEE